MPKHHLPGQCARHAALLSLTIGLISAPSEAACTLREGETVPSVVLPIRHEARHQHSSYYTRLLQLALDKTEDQYGICRVKTDAKIKPQARRYQDLERKNGTDVIDATSSHERSERFRAIPIPLLKGLMGYRIAFIRKADRDTFAQIKTLEDLRTLVAGQGEGWSDVGILRANGLKVVTANKHAALYRMLQAKRFDFFPRGAHEVLDELENFDTGSLIIEPNLLIAYPSPVYFYVHKDNDALAQRLTKGLTAAINDGSFDEFFYQHPLTAQVFHELNLNERTTFYLCNSDQSDLKALKHPNAWVAPWPDDLCEPTTPGRSGGGNSAQTNDTD